MLPTEMPSWSAPIAYLFASIFFILITIMYYEKIRRRCLGIAPNENSLNELPSQRQSVGLASADIRSLPAIQFREDFRKYNDRGNMDCAVCLGEFVEGEWMRLLPRCAHVFHVPCIDAWFLSRSTCPLCRTNVLYESDSRMMENQEVGHAVEIESDESVSSELGGSGNRITAENSRGATSRSATNVHVMSISPEDTSSDGSMNEHGQKVEEQS